MEDLGVRLADKGTRVADWRSEEDWLSSGSEIEMGMQNLAEIEGRNKE